MHLMPQDTLSCAYDLSSHGITIIIIIIIINIIIIIIIIYSLEFFTLALADGFSLEFE